MCFSIVFLKKKCDNLIKNNKSYFKFIFFLEFKRVITTRNSARKLEDEPYMNMKLEDVSESKA
jgi:hypothetical protein